MNFVDSSILDRYLGWRKQKPQPSEAAAPAAQWKAELEQWYHAAPEATEALEQAIAKVLGNSTTPAENANHG